MVLRLRCSHIFNGQNSFCLRVRKQNQKTCPVGSRNYAEKIQREHGGSPCFTKEFTCSTVGNDADALDVVLEFMEEKGMGLQIFRWLLADRRKQLSGNRIGGR